MPENPFRQLKTLKHISSASYFRFYLADLIEQDRALYLDCDIIINQPLTELYQTHFENKLLAAVNDMYVQEHWLLPYLEKGDYFNSGVLLIDLKRWREAKMAKLLESVAIDIADGVHFGDQCVLNILLREHTKILPYQFNFQLGYFTSMLQTHPGMTFGEYEAPVIIHYSSHHKPWQLGFADPKWQEIYWRYRNLSWAEITIQA